MRMCGELEATRRIFFVICEIDFPPGVDGDKKNLITINKMLYQIIVIAYGKSANIKHTRALFDSTSFPLRHPQEGIPCI